MPGQRLDLIDFATNYFIKPWLNSPHYLHLVIICFLCGKNILPVFQHFTLTVKSEFRTFKSALALASLNDTCELNTLSFRINTLEFNDFVYPFECIRRFMCVCTSHLSRRSLACEWIVFYNDNDHLRSNKTNKSFYSYRVCVNVGAHDVCSCSYSPTCIYQPAKFIVQ